MADFRPFRSALPVGDPDGRRWEMFHDYTLTKLAREHVRELLAEKQAHEVTKSRWPQRNGASGTIRGAASSGSCAEAAGACR